MPLNPQFMLQKFDKWEVYFVGLINPPSRCLGARYIITVTNYLTRWEDFEPIADCSAETSTNFLFENVVMRFRCPKVLMSNQGTLFVNKTIAVLT